MDTVQMQKRAEKNIDAKLDKIAYLLEELIKIHEEELYPSDDKIKVSVLKRLEKKARDIASGRRKTSEYSWGLKPPASDLHLRFFSSVLPAQ